MISNISNVDAHYMQQMSVNKATPSLVSVSTPPLFGFKTPLIKQKATIRIKKFLRRDNIIITGDIDDDYVDIVEETNDDENSELQHNFFESPPEKSIRKYLKNCYVIDYIQSPTTHKGLGTEAMKSLAEKAMFDTKADGRIVTFSAPVWKESSPALFFYKLGFRFMDPEGNKYMEECLMKKIPDIPPQVGMMYLPKANLHKLLRYGDVF